VPGAIASAVDAAAAGAACGICRRDHLHHAAGHARRPIERVAVEALEGRVLAEADCDTCGRIVCRMREETTCLVTSSPRCVYRTVTTRIPERPADTTLSRPAQAHSRTLDDRASGSYGSRSCPRDHAIDAHDAVFGNAGESAGDLVARAE